MNDVLENIMFCKPVIYLVYLNINEVDTIVLYLYV